jgi:hypothetical protein
LLRIGFIYIASIPLSIRAFTRLRQAAEELRAAGRGEVLEIERKRPGG